MYSNVFSNVLANSLKSLPSMLQRKTYPFISVVAPLKVLVLGLSLAPDLLFDHLDHDCLPPVSLGFEGVWGSMPLLGTAMGQCSWCL